MSREFMLPEALKGQQWERAKGELRAMVALQGSYQSTEPGDDGFSKWEELEAKVEAFIRAVEDDGLHE